MPKVSQKRKISGAGRETDNNYRVWFNDDKNVVYFKLYRPLTVEEVYEVQPMVQGLVKNLERRLVLIDLTEGSTDMVGREARQAFRETANPKDFDKIAVFGASAAVRMLAKVVIAITGVSKISQFFKTEEEALTWLKEV